MDGLNVSKCTRCDARFIDDTWVMWNDKLGENCTLAKRVCLLEAAQDRPGECANPTLEGCKNNPEYGSGWLMELPKLPAIEPFKNLGD